MLRNRQVLLSQNDDILHFVMEIMFLFGDRLKNSAIQELQLYYRLIHFPVLGSAKASFQKFKTFR